MFKHIALALIITTATFSSFATQFYEGQHYTVVSVDAPSSEPKLTEFFSFYCHNCYNMETKYMGQIKANLHKQINFDTKHVDFMNSEIGTEVMRSLAVMQQLGVSEKMTPAMFAAIQGVDEADGEPHDHSAHKPSKINNRDDIKTVFSAQGIDTSNYDKIADSSEVTKQIDLWRSQQKSYRIQSVPSFVVNDKYLINMNQIRSLNELISLINYLAVEHKEYQAVQ